MPSGLANIVDGSPQVLQSNIVNDIPGTSVQAPPLSADPTLSPYVRGTRNLALPDPAVGGYAENTAPMMQAVVDMGFSPHVWRGPLQGQGSIEGIPTAAEMTQVAGPGTQNTHGARLAQGVLTQLLSYQPTTTGSLGYIASLTGRQTEGGLGGIQ